jgi:hypothetical protein
MEKMLCNMQEDVLDIKVDLARLGGKVDNHIEEHNR